MGFLERIETSISLEGVENEGHQCRVQHCTLVALVGRSFLCEGRGEHYLAGIANGKERLGLAMLQHLQGLRIR